MIQPLHVPTVGLVYKLCKCISYLCIAVSSFAVQAVHLESVSKLTCTTSAFKATLHQFSGC